MTGKEEKRAIYYWDSCVFLAWFKAESDKNLGNIELVLRDVDGGKATIVSSTIAHAEILETPKSGTSKDCFRLMIKKPNMLLCDVSPSIAEKAGLIRSAIHNHRGSLGAADTPCLAVPDAIHIATAIEFGADAIHTFDTTMLKWNGHDFVDGIRICRPILLSGEQGLGLTY